MAHYPLDVYNHRFLQQGSNPKRDRDCGWGACGEKRENGLSMGGANTINQYLSAGLLDELWLHIVPVTIGSGARLFEGVADLQLEPFEISGTTLVTHIRYRVKKK